MNRIPSRSSIALRNAVASQLQPVGARRLASVVAGLSAAAVLLPSAVLAADSEGATLSEIIVTATRHEERLLDVPVSTSVLAGESLAAIGSAGDDIRQLAFRVPSLNIESSNGRTFPRFYIRGYGNTDFTSFASQPVSLVYDDIVQENPALKGFPIFDQADVEILAGPQGTLFGRNSPAGVVKLESAKPELGQFSGYGSLSDGTYNTSVLEGVVNLPLSEHVAMRFSTQGQHRDNWVEDPINNTKLEGYDDWAARVQLLYKSSDSFSALFNVHGRTLGGSARLFRANIIQPGTNSLVPGFDPAKFYADGYNGQSYSMAGGSAHLTWTLGHVTVQSITGYESILHYNTIGDIDGGYGSGNVFCNFGTCAPSDASGPGYIPFAVESGGGIKHHRQITQEVRALWKISSAFTAQAGVFLFDEDVEDSSHNISQTGVVNLDTTNSRQKNDAQAVFGSLEYQVTSAFTLRGGVRFTNDHKTFSVPVSELANGTPIPLFSYYKAASATNVSWDLGATYQLAPDTNLYARVATGFRAPSFGAPNNTTDIAVARSETNISYEAGIKSELLDHRARITFDVFYYDVSHQQLTAVGGLANTTTLLNAAHSIGQGAELTFSAKLTPTLSLNVSGSLNDTKIKDKNLAVGHCFDWSFVPGLADVHCNVTNPLDSNGNVLIDGNPLPQAAKYIADVSLRYSVPVGAGDGEFYAYTDWSYRSKINFFLYEAKEFTGPAMTQGGLRIGYTWADKKYDVAAFCRNCTNEIRAIGAIDFENVTGMINDPRIVGAQVSVKF
jgi:iron complex outermembrane receptor protein